MQLDVSEQSMRGVDHGTKKEKINCHSSAWPRVEENSNRGSEQLIARKRKKVRIDRARN